MTETDLLRMRDEAIADRDEGLIDLCNDALEGVENAWDEAAARWESEYRDRLD